jgi:glycosyltransferase involved in cell wall biosynthesis
VKIALIAPPWLPVPPPAYGGTEAVIDRLARGFSAAGADVLLITTGDSTCPVERDWVYPRAQTERMGNGLVELRHLIHAYDAAADADIVHDHTIFGPLYAGRAGRERVVTTNHGPFDDELTDIYRALGHRVPIICISRSQAATAVGLPIAKVIHHGVDPDAFRVGTGQGGYYLFLGRMTANKGPREAALAALKAGVRLLIAGKMREADEREYFAAEVQPLLVDGVEYVGEVAYDEKVELLGGAVALLNPIAWDEPFGLVMVESLACGTPVLAFPRGAAPEIVEHGITGFLCRDVDDMVLRLADARQLSRFRCRAAVEKHFSTDRMVREHLDLFEELLTRWV